MAPRVRSASHGADFNEWLRRRSSGATRAAPHASARWGDAPPGSAGGNGSNGSNASTGRAVAPHVQEMVRALEPLSPAIGAVGHARSAAGSRG